MSTLKLNTVLFADVYVNNLPKDAKVAHQMCYLAKFKAEIMNGEHYEFTKKIVEKVFHIFISLGNLWTKKVYEKGIAQYYIDCRNELALLKALQLNTWQDIPDINSAGSKSTHYRYNVKLDRCSKGNFIFGVVLMLSQSTQKKSTLFINKEKDSWTVDGLFLKFFPKAVDDKTKLFQPEFLARISALAKGEVINDATLKTLRLCETANKAF